MENNETFRDEQGTDKGQEETPKTYTQEELDKLIQSESDKRVSEALKTTKSKWEQEYKEKLEKEKQAAEEYAELTAKEKVEHDKAKLEAELAEYKRKDNINSMLKTAREVLAEEDLYISDELLQIVVTEEAETTNANVKNLSILLKAEIEKAVNEKLKGNTPKKMGGTGLTKDEILAIPDNIERQRMIAENIELFK